MKKILPIVIMAIFQYEAAFCQYGTSVFIDSLKNVLKIAKEDTHKIYTLNALSWSLNTNDPDKAMIYANQAVSLIDSLLSAETKKIPTLWLKKNLGIFYNIIGNIYHSTGNFHEAINFQRKALNVHEAIGAKQGISYAYGNMGVIYFEQGNYKEALENQFAALKIVEELRDTKNIAYAYFNIGDVYLAQSNYAEALNNFLDALDIFQKDTDKYIFELGATYSSIGAIYHLQSNTYNDPVLKKELNVKAMTNHLQALRIRGLLEDKSGIAESYDNIGVIYSEQKNYALALDYHFKSLRIEQEISSRQGMASAYINIAGIFQKQGKLKEAIDYYNKSLAIAKEIGSKENLRASYEGLTEVYAEKNDFKNAYEYHRLFSEIKDSIFNSESSKQITEMKTKYETEKKEQQIKLLNKDKEIQSKDLQRQKTIRNAVAGGLLLVLLFSFVLINRLVLIRKQKKVIEIEREKSEKLLLNILPKETADELKLNNKVAPKSFEMVTVMFTDFKGFTTIAEKMSAEELVSELDFIFKKFDEIISKYPIEKIKTIGDAYMCAGGLPVANTTNAIDVVMTGLEIQEWMKAQNKWQLRLGIHTGSVIAGVVGDKKFAYDIWGDTVNTASRMESSGEPNKVNISGSTYNLIKDKLQTTNYQLQTIYRGKIPAKNKGEIEMYFVERKNN